MAKHIYDQATRKIGSLDEVDFLTWSLGIAKESIGPDPDWIDTRTPPLPYDIDRTGDLVAKFRYEPQKGFPWAILYENQIKPDMDIDLIGMEKLARLGRTHRPDRLPGSRYKLALAVINLTGIGHVERKDEMPEAGVLLELKIKQRNLEEMDGEAHLRAIEGGTWGPSILALIPGMKKGDNPDIIKGVANLIRAIPNDRLRMEIAACTVVIAEAAKRRELWSIALGVST